jgi:hypothetical protein
MSGIGSSTCTLTLTRASRKLVKSGTNHFWQDVSATITGHSPTNAENLALFLFKGNTLVASGGLFSGTSSSATGAIALNTTELETLMTGARTGAVRSALARLYDGSSKELIGTGFFDIIAVADDYDDDSGATAVTPVTGTTVIWGKLAKIGSATYGKNETDGLWYPITFLGAGGAMQLDFGVTGITITE